MVDALTVSAPGRICLAGEHQDYLMLPVIPAAINLRIIISGKRRDDKLFNIELPDIGDTVQFNFENEIRYVLERDYLRSGVNVLKRIGLNLPYGYDCVIHGEIPINAGTSSSSALCVAWIKFLLTAGRHEYMDNPEMTGYLAYLAEVEEFGEPGGMMDQNASAIGNIIWVGFHPETRIEKLPPINGAFVLGDSGQEKDTKKTLARIKISTFRAIESIRKIMPRFSLQDTSIDDIRTLFDRLDDEDRIYLEGAMLARNYTKKAKLMIESQNFTSEEFGDLLNAIQDALREKVKVSTPKIDRMLDAAIKAGAYGGKVNGSGEGGCMFVYAPDDPEKVAHAIEKAGGKTYIIHIAGGARIDDV